MHAKEYNWSQRSGPIPSPQLSAHSPHAPDRRPCDVLQDGYAWGGFCEIFPSTDERNFRHALNALFRFIQYEDRFADALRRAQVPLLIEEQLTGRPFAPQSTHSLRLM